MTAPPTRILGLDLGSKRVGLAVSDADARIAFPAGVLARRGRKADLAALRALCAEREVAEIVVGLPIHLSGRKGPAAVAAAAFARALAEATGLPVALQDERWTTREAERALGDMGMDPAVRSWADTTTSRVLGGGVVDPSLAEAALQLSAQRAGPPMAAQFRERFERATTPGDRQQYLDALGSFRDTAVLDELLDYTLSGPLRPQEVMQLPTRLAEWPGSRDRLYRWLSQRYDQVLQHIPGHMMSRFMPIVRGCAPERFAEARTFFTDPAHTFPGARLVLERSGDGVDDCVRLAHRDGTRFAQYLRTAGGSP